MSVSVEIKSYHKPGSVAELLVIALPMMASQACETLMMFVDRLFLARLGEEHMSAAMGGGLTCFMFTTFFMGLTGFSNALVGQYLGARQSHRCAVVITQACIISLLAYPVILLGIPAGHWLFDIMGGDPKQLELQKDFFNILMFGTVFALLRNCLSCFFSGIGRTRVAMFSAFVAMVVNAISNYILIFGKLGLPALGIKGAAIGTLIGSFSGLLVTLYFYFNKRNRSEFNVRDSLRLDWTIMSKLLRLGTPSGMEFFLNILAFNLLVLNFYSYGTAVAAAITITFNWDMMSFIPIIGVNIAVTSLVGRYMGASDPDTAHKVTMSGLKIAVCYCALTFTAFSLFPGPLVEMFRSAANGSSFDEVVPLAEFMVRLISVYVFADALTLVFGGALRGAGDTFWTMCISVSGHWVLTLSAAFLIRVLHTGPLVSWMTVVVLILGLGLSFYLRYRSGKWRRLRIVEEPPPQIPPSGIEV